jgi:protein gp37
MAANSKIEWCDHTFNPWLGCTRVSPACDHCYAEGWAKRTGNARLWQGERRRTTEAYWRQPLKWNRQAEREGRRYRVFCASLADVFDNQVPHQWREDLWSLIEATPHLDWLLLTKRPQNITRLLMLPDPCSAQPWPWPNVWLGTTVENQAEADRRIPHLLSAPAAVHFLSCEPLLGPVDLTRVNISACWPQVWPGHRYDCLRGGCWMSTGFVNHSDMQQAGRVIDWIIAGGESGPKARPPMISWVRSLRDQCAAAQVPFFFKQWGKFIPDDPGGGHTAMRRVGKKAAGRLLDDIEHNAFPILLRALRERDGVKA